MNREQIKKWRDDPYGATGKYGMTRADFKQLCDLALRGLEAGTQQNGRTQEMPTGDNVRGGSTPAVGLEAGEPFGWVYEINGTYTLFSKARPPDDAYDEGTLHPVYASAPSGMVAVPIKFLRKVFMFLKQDCTPCAATDCQIDGKNLNVDALADELQALLSADPEVKP